MESLCAVAEGDSLLNFKGAGGQGVTEILSKRLTNEPVLVSPMLTDVQYNWLVNALMEYYVGSANCHWQSSQVAESRFQSRKLIFNVSLA